MNRFISLARTAIFATALIGATAAHADPINTLPFTSSLVSSDPIQHGRLSRNGVPSDGGTVGGTSDNVFPGIINPTTAYHFHPYTINVGADPFVVISIDSTSTTTFVSAYQSAYYVTNPATSYLGDPGTSGNYFGTDPLSFNFVATPFSQVVLIVNESTTNGGLNMPFTLYAQSFIDSDFDDYPGIDLAITSGGQVIPEPSTLLLLAPLALVAGLKGRRRRPTSAASIAA